ncbi:taste receptor type 2 member 40-like [Pleurodeles waltl]|uniref:taste receptor type 2 member 40-like n=1 Tax=Pleurodeles waltl TaxID=8319 RepID=UPI003709C5E6
MLPVLAVLSVSILGISTLAGIITNAFIVAVNLYIRDQGVRQNACDLIVCTLGISNILFLFTMTINDFCTFLWSGKYFTAEIYSYFNVLIFFPIFSSFWFTVCLCVFYCIQILIFTQPLLIKVKKNFSHFVPWLLMWSVLISLAISVPAAWSVDYELKKNTSTDLTVNITLVGEIPKLNLYYLLISNIIGCTVPLLLVGISNVLIIKSLVAHAKQMLSSTSSSTTRGEAGLRAAKTVTLLLFLYITFYISEILMFIDMFPPTSPWFTVCLIVIYLYSPIQSVILILGSPKLRSTSLKILSQFACCKWG